MELSFENILGEQEIENLFVTPEETPSSEDGGKKSGENPEEIDNAEHKTTEVDPDNLFGVEEDEEEKGEEEEDKTEKPESVGSGKQEDKDGKKEDITTEEGGGTSPNENFYSSIANALVVDGIFLNHDEEAAKKITDAEALGEAIEAEINARLDEKQQKISKALEAGVEPDEIRKFEAAIKFLNNVKDEELNDESEKGEQLRYRLIYQSYLNANMSPERADKLTMRSIEAGNDIEDAKEALSANKEFFQNKYDTFLREAEETAENERKEREKQAAQLKKALLEEKNVLGDMEISGDIRKKAYDNITKPIYKDPETGTYLTAIQKYEAENHPDFIKYVSLFYTLTNGFKDFKNLAKAEVKKEMRKGLKELEQTLNTTRRNTDGSLKMVTSVKEDPESFVQQGFRLDL